MKNLLRCLFELATWLLALTAVVTGLACSGFVLGCFYACARLGWVAALRLIDPLTH